MLKEQFFLFKNETNLKGEEKLIIQFKFFKIFAKEKRNENFFLSRWDELSSRAILS